MYNNNTTAYHQQQEGIDIPYNNSNRQTPIFYRGGDPPSFYYRKLKLVNSSRIKTFMHNFSYF